MPFPDIREFFDNITNVLSQLSDYNPVFGSINSLRYFIVFDYDKLDTDEVDENAEYKKIQKFIIDRVNGWIQDNMFTSNNPNGIKSLEYVKARISTYSTIEINYDRSGYNKASQITLILLGRIKSPKGKTNMDVISNIREDVKKMGWNIISTSSGLSSGIGKIDLEKIKNGIS
jgi:hypothetical protein